MPNYVGTGQQPQTQPMFGGGGEAAQTTQDQMAQQLRTMQLLEMIRRARSSGKGQGMMGGGKGQQQDPSAGGGDYTSMAGGNASGYMSQPITGQ